ncbi:MAG TPA: flagellar biosynthesis anti-sigma factor FlgM [Vicinamibacterales bacterium]
MRIDPNRAAGETGASDRIDGPADKSTRVGSQKAAADRVEVSDDAKRVQRMVAEVVQDAANIPAIRQDVVERARALLASGELGRDSGVLADAILNDLLDRP